MGKHTLLTKCMHVKYVLISKSQLNDVISKVNFQRMRIPLFMFYLTFSCGHYTTSKFAISRDFAEGFIGIEGLI